MSSGLAKLNLKVAQELGVNDEMEAVVAGKTKGRWKILSTDSIPSNEVWMNGDEMKARGLADNTIATVRKPRQNS